jgi:hypothetical protein
VLYPDEELLRIALRGAAAYQLPWFDAHLWAYARALRPRRAALRGLPARPPLRHRRSGQPLPDGVACRGRRRERRARGRRPSVSRATDSARGRPRLGSPRRG